MGHLGSGEDDDTQIIPCMVVPTCRCLEIPSGLCLEKGLHFRTKWVNEGIDRMNLLNLVTGKSKYLTDFNLTAKHGRWTRLSTAREYLAMLRAALSVS